MASTVSTRVTVAFWLWWPLFAVESGFIVYVFVKTVELSTAQYGPSVFGVILMTPIMLLQGALLIWGMAGAFAMRHGGRGARVGLLVLAIITAVIVIWQLPEHVDFDLDDQSVFIATAAVTVLALVGAVLPFLPPTSQYFAAHPDDSTPMTDSAD